FQAGGRTFVFEPDGSLDRLCGLRVGIGQTPLIPPCHGIADPVLYLNLFTMFAPALFLFWRSLRQPSSQEPLKGAIYLYILIVGVMGYVAAHAVLFKLYLPNRYIGKPATMVLALALGNIFGLVLKKSLAPASGSPGEIAWPKPALFYGAWIGGFI